MIQLSSRARIGYARLFQAYNDIDIYVEDSTYAGVYERVFNNALNGKGRIERVIPLGSRDVVVARAKEDVENSGRPRLYIVDGDLDLIAWGRMPSIKNLYRLKCYSLENLLFEEAAVRAFCSFAFPKKTARDAWASIGWSDLIADLNSRVASYITLLAVARRLDLRHGTLAINHTSISRKVNGKYVGTSYPKWIRQMKEIMKFISKEVGPRRFRIAKVAVADIKRRKARQGIHFVPGRNFAITYLNERVGAAGGNSLSQSVIISFLADHCQLSRDPMLKNIIRRLGKANPSSEHSN